MGSLYNKRADKEDSNADLGSINSYSVNNGSPRDCLANPRQGEGWRGGQEVGSRRGRLLGVIIGLPARKRRRTIPVSALEKIAPADVGVDAGADICKDNGGGGPSSCHYSRGRRGRS